MKPLSLVAIALITFTLLVSSLSQDNKSSGADPKAIRDNATLTIVFKSGANVTVSFDDDLGTLSRLKDEWPNNLTDKPKVYSYQSTNAPRGSIAVDYSQIAAVHQASR